MYCSYHPRNAARVQCISCTRRLCAACDHRIKGYPYCQDCIVMGVENLSRQHQSQYQASHSKGKARLAALCALLPGMGAVYNRQNVKAVVHFVTIIGLFQLSDLHVFEALFGMAGVAFYVYSIIDAYRTARLIAQGETPAADEARFKRGLARRAPAIGAGLIVTGLLMVLQLLRPLGLYISMGRLIPVVLIIFGGFLLTRYFKRSRMEDQAQDYSHRPFSLISGALSDDASHASRQTWGSGNQR
jgi:TM2 domain-containing membrane protein YozV